MDTDQAGIKLNWNKVPFPQDEWRYMHVAFSQTRKSWARKPESMGGPLRTHLVVRNPSLAQDEKENDRG